MRTILLFYNISKRFLPRETKPTSITVVLVPISLKVAILSCWELHKGVLWKYFTPTLLSTAGSTTSVRSVCQKAAIVCTFLSLNTYLAYKDHHFLFKYRPRECCKICYRLLQHVNKPQSISWKPFYGQPAWEHIPFRLFKNQTGEEKSYNFLEGSTFGKSGRCLPQIVKENRRSFVLFVWSIKHSTVRC